MEKFQIDTKKIHIANSEENVSKTIEELLALNDKIPAKTDEEIMDVTEKQLEKSKYMNKPSRGEEEAISEVQFGDRKADDDTIVEVKLEAAGADGGHRPEMWDKDEEEVRGHKDVAPIWHEVYKKEDDRKKKETKNSL